MTTLPHIFPTAPPIINKAALLDERNSRTPEGGLLVSPIPAFRWSSEWMVPRL